MAMQSSDNNRPKNISRSINSLPHRTFWSATYIIFCAFRLIFRSHRFFSFFAIFAEIWIVRGKLYNYFMPGTQFDCNYVRRKHSAKIEAIDVSKQIGFHLFLATVGVLYVLYILKIRSETNFGWAKIKLTRELQYVICTGRYFGPCYRVCCLN
jgi:glucan phosphoethanolaminetransferase (alkaline phosphatase superfamily)